MRRANAIVTLRENEHAESAVKRLTRALTRNGTFTAMRRHAFYVPPSQAKRLKSKVARSKRAKAQKRIEAARAEYELRRFGSSSG